MTGISYFWLPLEQNQSKADQVHIQGGKISSLLNLVMYLHNHCVQLLQLGKHIDLKANNLHINTKDICKTNIC